MIVKIEHTSRIIINYFPVNRRLSEKLAGVFLVLIMVAFIYGLFYTINLVLLTSKPSIFISYIFFFVIIYLISATIAVKGLIGFIKGKSAIHIARNFVGRKMNFVGQNFWARGYYVSTTGKDEEVIREYIRRQEEEDRRIDQLGMFE